MTNDLSLVVSGAGPGQYLWSIVQRSSENAKAVTIDFAMGPLPTEAAALLAGSAALERIKHTGTQATGGWSGQFAETLPAEL